MRIRSRRPMNQANRAALAMIASNPSEIAHAAMGPTGRLPDYQPPQPNPGPQRNPPIAYPNYVPQLSDDAVANLLSDAQRLWLQRRALWFGVALLQITGQSGIADPATNVADFPETIAYLAAVALVGDDYDPVTQGITPGWTDAQWTAAYNYVRANIGQWWSAAYAGQPAAHQRHLGVQSWDWRAG